MFRPRTKATLSVVRVFIRLFSDRGSRKHVGRQSLFRKALTGNCEISSKKDAFAFLSATLNQKDSPIGVVEEILASRHGLKSLHNAFNIDDAPEYMDAVLQPVLSWLQYPALQSASNGLYLRRTLQALVNPPGSKFWKSFPSHVKYELVNQHSMQSFAWLLLQLLTHSSKVRPFDLMIAKDPLLQRVLAESPRKDTRYFGQRIQRVCDLHRVANLRSVFEPQHDNDFQNFKHINIFPSAPEISSPGPPRIKRAVEIFEELAPAKRLYVYLEHLFRLYRQDWLEDIKEQIQVSRGQEAQFGRVVTSLKVKMAGVSCSDKSKKNGKHPWALKLECLEDIPELKDLNQAQRQKFIKDDSDFMPDGSLGLVIADGEPVAIVKVLRDEALLVSSIICIQMPNRELVQQTMLSMINAAELELVLLNTAGYAYEPVLARLQNTTELPFEQELLFWEKDRKVIDSEALGNPGISNIVKQLQEKPELDLQKIMELKHSVVLDASQAQSLVASLSQRLSLVQGPPGTGKSFVGALAAKALHDHTDEKILIICNTNQALDQFIQDIRKVGVKDSQIVRLGGQERTESANHPLLLSSLRVDSAQWHDRDTRFFIKDIERQVVDEAQRLGQIYDNLTSLDRLREHLDGMAMRGDPKYSQAFEISLESNGTRRVTENGGIADKHYLLQRWLQGDDFGVFPEKKRYGEVWNLSSTARKKLSNDWWSKINPKEIAAFSEIANHHDDLLDQAKNANGQIKEQIIRSKRIIACTTSGAAIYPQVLNEAPGIVIVEEAGQVLESHIVAALSPTAKQLIMIGDHKQLRPFINYKLSVEKGDGYDLNRSMFERLVLKGYPHQVLAQQHRMRPEISDLVRKLTYPDLIDAPKTRGRPDLRGFSDNVIFVDHSQPEDQASDDPETVNVRMSKKNSFEAEMCFKTVKYLLQQNYSASNIVVLTPYLGQLKKLQEVFSKEYSTALGALDVMHLERNGLITDSSEVKDRPEGIDQEVESTSDVLSPAVVSETEPSINSSEISGSNSQEPQDENTKAKSSMDPAKRTTRPKIQISTIDNYQGQESDIVIASLTRSNPENDIGFLNSPERLNVLLSRARNAIIIFGNASTFKNAHSGAETWTSLFKLLETGKHIYEGLPIKCENHPHNTALLTSPEEFGEKCPEGGCTEPCGVKLRCGVHECPSKCHHLGDHSEVLCRAVVEELCNRGLHVQRFECHERLDVISKPCEVCLVEDEAERQRRGAKDDSVLSVDKKAESK